MRLYFQRQQSSRRFRKARVREFGPHYAAYAQTLAAEADAIYRRNVHEEIAAGEGWKAEFLTVAEARAAAT